MRVGYVGIGNMGGPMAANLARAGNEVIIGDLNQAAVDAFTGEHVGDSAVLITGARRATAKGRREASSSASGGIDPMQLAVAQANARL